MLGFGNTVYPIEYTKYVHSVLSYCFMELRWICVIFLPMYFRVTSQALGQSYDCPSASEVTLKDMNEIDQNKPQQNANNMHNSWDVLCFNDEK